MACCLAWCNLRKSQPCWRPPFHQERRPFSFKRFPDDSDKPLNIISNSLHKFYVPNILGIFLPQMQRSVSYSSAHLREHKQSSQPFRQPTMLRCGQELRLRMASVYLQVVGVSLMCICDKVSSERSSWDGDQLTLQSARHLYMLAVALHCGILLTHQYAPNDIRSQALRECTDSFLSSNSDQSAYSV